MIARLGTVALVAAIAGCAIAGPASIRGGRLAYNEAIIATNDQQMLAMIVRMRYGESTGLLAVSSITASMAIQASVGGQVGIGSSSSYEGNLVPLSVGASYEENPTISYAPVQGEEYMRQVLSPLPIDLTVLVLGARRGDPHALTFLVQGINGIRNPALLAGSVGADPRFARVAELVAGMGGDDEVQWTTDKSGHVLVLRCGGENLPPRARELFDILGIAPPEPTAGIITLPVVLGIGRPREPAIHLDTRSLWELFQIAASSVDVPQADIESRTAPPLPPQGPAGQSIRIRRAKKAPDSAVTAVRRGDWWYYIEGTDAESKVTFRILENLMSVRMADSVGKQAAPVLTIPASR